MFQSLSQLNNRLSLGGVLLFHRFYTYVGCICQRARTPFTHVCSFFSFFFFFCCVHAAESEQIDTYLIWIKDERPFFLNKRFD